MDAPALDGPAGGHEGLRGDLAAEHPLAVLVGTDASEDVHLDGLEIEELHQEVERFAHGVIISRTRASGECFATVSPVTDGRVSRGLHLGHGDGRSPDRGRQRQQRLVGLRAHAGFGLCRVERGCVRQLEPVGRGPRPRRPDWGSALTGSRWSGAGSNPKKTSGRRRASTTTGVSSPGAENAASCRSSPSSHFTNPRWLADRGGWEAADAPERFARFCATTAAAVGDLVGIGLHDERAEHRLSDGVYGRCVPSGRARCRASTLGHSEPLPGPQAGRRRTAVGPWRLPGRIDPFDDRVPGDSPAARSAARQDPPFDGGRLLGSDRTATTS